ncbi:MAG: urease accessory protein UreD [Planctomycetota bacterium]
MPTTTTPPPLKRDETPPRPSGASHSGSGRVPGRGTLSFEIVAGQTAITRCRAHAPLKLLTPARPGGAAWVYASTFGGGLVAGDRVDLELHAGPHTTAVLTTQASTKVFHQQDGIGAEQRLTATVDQDARLLVLPDPLTCFADAAYRQTQRFTLGPTASLVLLDWFTAGRVASGERWDFAEYRSLNVVTVGGREVVFDQTRITADTLSTLGPLCVGGYDVLANVFLIGPAVSEAAAELRSWVAKQPIRDEAGYAVGFSPTDWGGVLRLAGRDTQTLTAVLRQRLSFTRSWLGGCAWSRKW